MWLTLFIKVGEHSGQRGCVHLGRTRTQNITAPRRRKFVIDMWESRARGRGICERWAMWGKGKRKGEKTEGHKVQQPQGQRYERRE